MPRLPRFQVTPASGTRATEFRVRFRALYVVDDARDLYRVLVYAPDRSCSRKMIAAPAPRSRDVVLVLPPPTGRTWCAGRYKGFVEFVDFKPGVTCKLADARADLCSRERPVGRFFTFRVR